MLFQVIKDNQIKMQTTSKECIPSEEDIKHLKKLGYKIKIKE